MPEQYTLGLDLPQVQSLDNFIQGANAELVNQLATPHRGPASTAGVEHEAFHGLWIYGAHNSGRSHLLPLLCAP